MLIVVEPIFEARTRTTRPRSRPSPAERRARLAQRMEREVLVTRLLGTLYRGDMALHLAAAGLRYDAARALVAAGARSTQSTGATAGTTPVIRGHLQRPGIPTPSGESSSC
jgi:hypothetical protein